MSNAYTRLLLTDPRAKRKAGSTIAFEGYGFQITELTGNEGDYWDVKFPGETTIHELSYFNLCISGRLDCVNEIDGIPYVNDVEHPLSAPMGQDGKPTDEVHLVRRPGLTRMYFHDNTKRLCIYPVDSFGQMNADPIGFKHLKGPVSFVLPRTALFILSRGAAVANGAEITAPNVVYAKTMDVPIAMQAGSYGGTTWKT